MIWLDLIVGANRENIRVEDCVRGNKIVMFFDGQILGLCWPFSSSGSFLCTVVSSVTIEKFIIMSYILEFSVLSLLLNGSRISHEIYQLFLSLLLRLS